MSRYVEVLAYVQVVLSVGFQGAIIALQIGAYRRHHHVSFALLAVSTACGIAYLLVAIAPHVLQTDLGATVVLYSAGFLLFLGQGLLGLLGIASLFRVYRKLAEGTASTI